MAEEQKTIAELEAEGTRLHYCIASERLGGGRDSDGDYDGDKPAKRKSRKPDDDATARGY